MQPVGGMDRIWQQLLLQPVPAQSCDYDQNALGRLDFAGRDSGDLAGQRFVGDLVRLEHTVKYVDNVPDGVMIGVDGLSGPVVADFCIITAAPALVGGDRTAPASGDSGYSIPVPDEMAITTNLAPRLKRALADVRMTPAIKVGLQGRTRFWEKEDEIYGGISLNHDAVESNLVSQRGLQRSHRRSHRCLQPRGCRLPVRNMEPSSSNPPGAARRRNAAQRLRQQGVCGRCHDHRLAIHARSGWRLGR